MSRYHRKLTDEAKKKVNEWADTVIPSFALVVAPIYQMLGWTLLSEKVTPQKVQGMLRERLDIVIKHDAVSSDSGGIKAEVRSQRGDGGERCVKLMFIVDTAIWLDEEDFEEYDD